MKYIILTIFILLAGCSPSAQKTSEGSKPRKDTVPTLEKATVVSYQNINVDAFNEGIKDESIIVIDVRTPEEISAGKIDGAIELDFYSDDFADKLLAMDKEKEYYLYCKMGGRSAKTARLMINNGFDKVNNLEGGYTAWKKNAQE